jgi:hypothetical protein
MVEMRSALAFAKQYRTCPPPHMYSAPGGSVFLKQHLSICPHCASQEVSGYKEWDEFVECWKNEFPASGVEDEEILPRQVRFIHPQMAVWREGLYYNPPGVLVLEKTAGVPDTYRVAQVYHDTSLAGPGDLVVDNARTGIGDIMVECWNTYSMKGSYLGPAVGRVPDEVLSSVIRMEKDLDFMPPWSAKPLPMGEEDVRIYFRELEAEVGYVFAAAAVSELMAEIERKRLVLVYDSGDEMKTDVSRRIPGVSWPERFETPEEGLAAARLPIERYAMAAADDASEVEAANFVLVKGGIVLEIRPMHAEILQKTMTPAGVTIGGRIIDMPKDKGERRLIAFLTRERETMLGVSELKWNESTGHFTANFKLLENAYGNLKLALFCYRDDE